MTPSSRTAARTGALAALVLAAGLLATPPATAQAAAPAAPAAVTLAQPASTLDAAARPRNGTILYARISGGLGKLKIQNGTRKDGVVTLVRGRSKAISIYVRARSSATVRNVKDGTYRIYFTTGYRFSVSKGRFTREATYQRFNRRLTFRTTSSTSTVWTLTLNPVIGGNASTTNINPKDFPA
ncbi:hypothetical protein HNP84_002688 [Thermocatellispora tengchongensis]|uniref:Uncharacterized protein n=1 Tax=Thermocatellispora tengchongensis TaxID=1073253 RepID=A0A840P6W8_9ACTN|nr:hypothetical protein [Thermocatellispora tengchongensis]MBB5132967.1 hypothetical protein [Thermocatellispora tengchongensis]